MEILGVSIQTGFTVAWVIWIVQFAIIETLALVVAMRMKREEPYDGGTLSEFVWRFIRLSKWVFIAFSIFWLWLTLHFLTGKV